MALALVHFLSLRKASSMSDSFTWRRGSGELGVIDKFTELARKASEEAGADVTVVLNFPQGYLTVIASTPEEPAHQPPWTPRALAKGLNLVRQWLRRHEEGEDRITDDDLSSAIERLKSIRH
jgi:hypothetical protein